MSPMRLPMPPLAVPVDRSLERVAPRFRDAVNAVLARLPDARLEETLRTPQRQSFLYGFGRDYDDGRGIVTQAPTHLTSWHGYGLAADIVHRSRGWDAGRLWFRLMGEIAEANGLAWGGRWKSADLPHVQGGRCKDSPSDEARRLYAEGGLPAVWKVVRAL
jgi:peptidoglycan L-alanyl-D-glutamate endopeptidase CwlK